MPIARGPPRRFTRTEHGFEALLLDNLLLRVHVLEHDLVHVQLGDPQTEERASWMVVDGTGDVPWGGRDKRDLSRFSCPSSFSLEYDEAAHQAELRTNEYTVRVRLQADLHISMLHLTHGLFYSDREFEAYEFSPTAIRHSISTPTAAAAGGDEAEEEEYFGFGECSGALNKRGQRIRVEARDAMGYDASNTDPLYKHWPYHFARTTSASSLVYGMLYDTMRTAVFDLGKEVSAFRGPYRYFETARPECGLDYYLFAGSAPPVLSSTLALLVGRAALPPKWAMGYLASGMSYTESDDAQHRLGAFIHKLREHKLLAPQQQVCTAFHLSSGYTTHPDTGVRCVFTWNAHKIPDPRRMFAQFADSGMHVIANVKPWLIRGHHPQFAAARKAFFSSQRNPNEPATGRFWAGGAGTSLEGCYLDFTNPAAVAWWKQQLTAQLLDFGCDAIWNDNNEYELLDGTSTCSALANRDAESVGRALQPLLMARASLKALQEKYGYSSPLLVVSRSGSIGTHRYAAQTWSGDNSTSWTSLRFNITMCLSLGLSGWPSSGCDVGGFAGERPSSELLWRWVQCGVFLPRFSIHSSVWKGGSSNTEPWMHADVAQAVLSSMQTRHMLVTQLYSLHLEAQRTGFPVARALLFHYFADCKARAENFSFMWGRHVLIAPVHQQGVTKEWPVYLPQEEGEGEEVWFDVDNLRALEGGRTHLVKLADVSSCSSGATWFAGCPVFVRQGGGLVMDGDEYRVVAMMAGGGSNAASLTWYEEGGWEFTCTVHGSEGGRGQEVELWGKQQPVRDNEEAAAAAARKKTKETPPFTSAKVIIFYVEGESSVVDGGSKPLAQRETVVQVLL